MKKPDIILVHPPMVKPSEPPAGLARLAGALRSHCVACTLVDANIEGFYHLTQSLGQPQDTWSRRAHRHLPNHLSALQTHQIYSRPDAYRRAVADINRLLSRTSETDYIQIGLANYTDKQLSPLRSADLASAAEFPERNPFHSYFQEKLLPQITASQSGVVGISINYLSQALCAFALIGLLKKNIPDIKVIIGGGLVTSWLKRLHQIDLFDHLIDKIVSGPGESALLKWTGCELQPHIFLPDYSDLFNNTYLSPGPVLPFSTSDGCWWRRCAFCPEYAEQNPFRPLPHHIAVQQIETLIQEHNPAIVHLLDNALSPSLLKSLAAEPLKAPWYGFVRIAPPLDDLNFCHRLAASGCVMLKIGLESGDQKVLDALDKGIQLDMASKVLQNLAKVGIATYVYLLFGTPAENRSAATKTLHFAADHHNYIDFLNLAIFNLPLGGPDSENLTRHSFYPGDLALYSDFEHPLGWHRSQVRQFLNKQFKKHPQIQPIIRRDPPIFTSNHAPFFSMYRSGSGLERRPTGSS